ncbi:hypothetical protein [Costertonia aggregata]|uniref:Uncharacterized protein n=1 Tax=Costertonia aggregata TaxID=343403 RepID=A0A7H9AUG9_9FLAO|nr:hypothetical protein [Costertonia aggregata]QLG46942.1 hypothetical protein HYG79_16805 [Costertonia aggregata]
MRYNTIILITIITLIVNGCYDSEEDLTVNRQFSLRNLQSKDSIIANGFSFYSFEVEVPGVRYGGSKEISLESTWGEWNNGTNSSTIQIKYNKITDSYTDTVLLKAGRVPGAFSIAVTEKSSHLGTYNFDAIPQYPSFIQILADSVQLKLSPGNTTKIRALFSNDNGFPSYNTKFRFKTQDPVSIFPRDVFIDSAETIATLQISTETRIDTVKVYGELPDLHNPQQFFADTLKIKIINE